MHSKCYESTTLQVTNSQYWSNSLQRIVIARFRFVQICQKNWSGSKLHVTFESEWPKCELEFDTFLLQSLEYASFPDIGMCQLHIIHNSFSKGVISFKFDVDQFVHDFNFFFKLSATWHADYKDIPGVASVTV